MSTWDAYKKIVATRRGRILTLTLNNPERMNAVCERMHAELTTVFDDADNDPDSDIIVLTGAGRAFSAGGDLDWMQRNIDNPAGFHQSVVEVRQTMFSLLDCEKPVLAMVNGDAIGLGATLALFCDVVFAADTAKIGDPHVAVGLAAGDGGAVIWPQLIGYARAKEFLMTGDLLSAAEAERLGLINHCVPAGELEATVGRFADRLAAGALKAIRMTKMSVNVRLRQVVQCVLDASLAHEEATSRSADHQEAVAAFREKRKPRFTGK